MTRSTSVTVLGLLVALMLVPGGASAQTELDRAVERARGAWLSHDIAALLHGSDTVRLRLREVARAESVRPGQAARLLERYLGWSKESSFRLHKVRRLAPDHAYAEMIRLYVVQGTSEVQKETVYLGFRLLDGRWRLREVRITP